MTFSHEDYVFMLGGEAWAQRLKRVFNIVIETCKTRGGSVKIVACIEDPLIFGIRKFVYHIYFAGEEPRVICQYLAVWLAGALCAIALNERS
ncbi:MAG: hypothetical protein ACI8W7_002187 [Gammaproteobacteria bacterium]|jgi:hypothetical protein